MDDKKVLSKVEEIYGNPYIDNPYLGYLKPQEKKPYSMSINQLCSKAFEHLVDRVNFEGVFREIVFISICFFLFISSHNGAFKTQVEGLQLLAQTVPLFVAFYLLFKTSFKSIIPGLFCLILGYILQNKFIAIHYLDFLSSEHINYLIIAGFILTPLSLIKEHF